MTVRIFLLDDHEIVRRGLRELFETQDDFDVVGEASNAEEAMTRVPPTRPDVAVLDVRLPGTSGIEVCRDLRAELPELRCLMLTSFADDDALFAAILAGASGYLVKGLPQEMLVNAVRRVHAGARYLPPPMSQALAGRTPDSNLSAREREVLVLLAKGSSNKEIASALGITEATVKCHVSVILARLGANDRTQAVVNALRRGLVHL